jgi:hypothetical protein
MRTSILTLLLAATCGTVVLTGTVALGGPSPAGSRARSPAVRLPAPEHLSAATRAEVRNRMGRHGNTMSNLVRALVLLDRPTIANLAERIADEEVVARVESGGPDKLRLLLPKEFFTEGTTLQSSARDLAAAAVNKEADSVLADRFAAVAKTCVSCHSIYLGSPSGSGR